MLNASAIDYLARHSQWTLMILTGKSQESADAKKIGQALVFDYFWEQTGVNDAILRLIKGRKIARNVEQAILYQKGMEFFN